MADETETETKTKTEKKTSGLMTMIKAVAFISVIVLLQVAAASMLIPSAEETAEIAGKLANAASEEDASTTNASTDSAAPPLLATGDMREVALGFFHILSNNTKSGSRTNVDFELFGTVLADEESEFFSLFEAREKRIREQVLITLRGSDVTDLTDPTLGLIKRKILEKTNRALGKPLLHEAIFSKFSFEER
jgi:flagellar FliL protein